MTAVLSALSLLVAVIHTPILWIIGLVLLIAGVIGLVRGSIIFGIVLIVIGVVLGALNLL